MQVKDRGTKSMALLAQWSVTEYGRAGDRLCQRGRRPLPSLPPQLMIPSEVAHDTIVALGEVGMLQFKDLNPEKPAFQRTYAGQVNHKDLLVLDSMGTLQRDESA